VSGVLICKNFNLPRSLMIALLGPIILQKYQNRFELEKGVNLRCSNHCDSDVLFVSQVSAGISIFSAA